MLLLTCLRGHSVFLAVFFAAAWLALASFSLGGEGAAAEPATSSAPVPSPGAAEAPRSPETVKEMFTAAAIWILPVVAGVYLILRLTAGKHPGD